MSAYNEGTLSERLNRLTNTQESIQTLSHWITFHKRHASTSVHIWNKDFQQANDVIQHGRKKGSEFVEAFKEVITEAILATYQTGDDDIRNSVKRLLHIWLDRRIFPTEMIETIRNRLGIGTVTNHTNEKIDFDHAKTSEVPKLAKELVDLYKMIEHVGMIGDNIETISNTLSHRLSMFHQGDRNQNIFVKDVDTILNLIEEYESKLKSKQELHHILSTSLLEEYQKQQQFIEKDLQALLICKQRQVEIMNLKEELLRDTNFESQVT